MVYLKCPKREGKKIHYTNAKEQKTMTNILVYFAGCSEPIGYTTTILDLLITDPDTETICDATTGEVLYHKA